MKNDIKLDDFEKEIENNSESYAPVPDSQKRRIESLISGIRKSKNINIRINSFDLELLRKRAEEEGIPYQTLISSIIHKYISNQLIEERGIYNILKMLAK